MCPAPAVPPAPRAAPGYVLVHFVLRGAVRAKAVRLNFLHIRDEPIALAHDRLDEARLGGIVVEHRADAIHGGVDSLNNVNRPGLRPKVRCDILPRDQVTGPLEQQDQKLHWYSGQGQPSARAPKFIAAQVQLVALEPEHFGFGFRLETDYTPLLSGLAPRTALHLFFNSYKRLDLDTNSIAIPDSIYCAFFVATLLSLS